MRPDALYAFLLQGEEVTVALLNVIVAACCQVGDLARAFETFEVRMSWVLSCANSVGSAGAHLDAV